MSIQANLRAIQDQISKQATKSVRLVAVSKTKPNNDILAAYDAGHRHFGENYVQELVEKAQELPKDINWHFIGSIQSNKIKQLCSIPNLYVVETIDSEKKAFSFEKASLDRDTPLKIFMQVNTSGEETKSGISPKDAVNTARTIKNQCPHLQFAGLMTIGSPEASKYEINPDFEILSNLKVAIERELGFDNLELSMGMSDDYLMAVNQGSTNIRVGSSIFGTRNYSNKT
jgi:PLP dependent protein